MFFFVCLVTAFFSLFSLLRAADSCFPLTGAAYRFLPLSISPLSPSPSLSLCDGVCGQRGRGESCSQTVLATFQHLRLKTASNKNKNAIHTSGIRILICIIIFNSRSFLTFLKRMYLSRLVVFFIRGRASECHRPFHCVRQIHCWSDLTVRPSDYFSLFIDPNLPLSQSSGPKRIHRNNRNNGHLIEKSMEIDQ